MITLNLTRGKDLEGIYIRLPAPQEKIEEAIARLDVISEDMSAFFSIHYLTIYYLLQPYTAGTEMKSGTYRIVMILTYVVCYAMMNLRLPILVFGVACIAFCVVYSIVASILVYRFAPQTFRLRT